MLTLFNLSTKNSKKISFTLGDCCCLNIIGKKDSGKTEILEYIANINRPFSGQILYAQEVINSANKKEINKKYLKEYSSIINYLPTIRDNSKLLKNRLTTIKQLEYWAKIYDNSFEKIMPALSFFKLEEYIDIKIKDLDQNIKKKILLCKLMIAPNEIWLIDEPYLYLKKSDRKLLDGLIKARCDQGGTVILASRKKIENEMSYYINL